MKTEEFPASRPYISYVEDIRIPVRDENTGSEAPYEANLLVESIRIPVRDAENLPSKWLTKERIALTIRLSL